MINKITALAALAIAALSFQSCIDKDDKGYDLLLPNTLVTVKPEGDSFKLQLDDETVIIPTNMTKSPCEKEQRAFANINLPAKPWNKEIEAEVNWINPILTKATVKTEGSADEDKEKYGEDPVEMVKLWTVCEDGYLTIQFRTMWSRYGNTKHAVNLITGVDPEDPYTVEFRHDACGDYPEVIADGYVAFRLNSLPDTGDETVKLKVKYLSNTGMKTVEFDYKTRPGDTGSDIPDEGTDEGVERAR